MAQANLGKHRKGGYFRMLRKLVERQALLFLVLLTLWGLIIRADLSNVEIGDKIDSYQGVAIFENGSAIDQSQGRHFSKDGYYYGQKWQCVEFVKRFYYDVLNHRMPDTFGHAKDFFDFSVPQGGLNACRGLVQYRNGGDIKPQKNDLLVYTNTEYGHVAIVAEVESDWIEIVQQNAHSQARQKLVMTVSNGRYYVGNRWQPAGWLRKE